MSYIRLSKNRMLQLLSFILLLAMMVPAQAAVRTISGTVVDSESRESLGDVEVELQVAGNAVHTLTTSAGKAFSFEHDFNETDQYTLRFTKADYYPQQIDLSNAMASNNMPEQLTVSMSGEDSEFVFTGKALNRESNQPIQKLKVTMLNLMTGEQVTTRSDQNGNYKLNITSGYEYDVVLESPFHLKRFAKINFCNDRLQKNDKYCFSGFSGVSLNDQGGISGASVLLDKIELGKKFKVDNIYYDYNKATVKKSALPNLRKVLYILMDNPQITIELGSHADSRGSDSYNLELSQRRADAAVSYIVQQGIDRSRIESKGYGETVLVNDCGNDVKCPDEAHAKNRRTEFIIVGIDETYFAQK
ncbi:OmpA family protein [Leucothrix pacifica]|nr:OmpA family protein [Leucothrix pacifica]